MAEFHVGLAQNRKKKIATKKWFTEVGNSEPTKNTRI